LPDPPAAACPRVVRSHHAVDPLPRRVRRAGCVRIRTGTRSPPKGDAYEQDEFEEKAIARAVERIQKAADSEGRCWECDLAKAFPEKFKPGLIEAEVEKWFDLLAGEHREWRRDAAPNRSIAELFDRLVQRMELGPVPSIRREEFMQFAKSRLVAGVQRQAKPEDRNADAERAFRVLDRDGSGTLEPSEWTDWLRADLKVADADGHRKISAEEYREYFGRKVNDAVENAAALAAKADAPLRNKNLPAWFKTLDTDGDGQVGLYEWRAGNRPLQEFMAMDLDGDGLLPPDEYLRYVAQAADAARSQAAEKKNDTPPEQRAGMEKK
jgi:Ca2+-binding EF-hand superfamily protein